MNRAQTRGMDLYEGHKTAGRSPLTCENEAKARREKRLFKTESGQPWMFVHSFSAVIMGMLLAGPIVPCGNILTQPQAAQPKDLSSPFLYKRYRNPTLGSAQKLQKHDLLFHEAQFCVRAASARRCNCRSTLPVVDLALITSPMALFLPQLRSSTLAQSIQGISPSNLGVSVSTQMATQAPCMSNTLLDHVTGSDITLHNVCFTCSEQ